MSPPFFCCCFYFSLFFVCVCKPKSSAYVPMASLTWAAWQMPTFSLLQRGPHWESSTLVRCEKGRGFLPPCASQHEVCNSVVSAASYVSISALPPSVLGRGRDTSPWRLCHNSSALIWWSQVCKAYLGSYTFETVKQPNKFLFYTLRSILYLMVFVLQWSVLAQLWSSYLGAIFWGFSGCARGVSPKEIEKHRHFGRPLSGVRNAMPLAAQICLLTRSLF